MCLRCCDLNPCCTITRRAEVGGYLRVMLVEISWMDPWKQALRTGCLYQRGLKNYHCQMTPNSRPDTAFFNHFVSSLLQMRRRKELKYQLTKYIFNLSMLIYWSRFLTDQSVHISCAGGKDSKDSVRRGNGVKRNAMQVLKVNRSSVKWTERGHKLTLFRGGSAEVSGTGPLQASGRRQDSCSTSVFLKSCPGSMTLIRPHLNERLSCFNEDIPAN